MRNIERLDKSSLQRKAYFVLNIKHFFAYLDDEGELARNQDFLMGLDHAWMMSDTYGIDNTPMARFMLDELALRGVWFDCLDGGNIFKLFEPSFKYSERHFPALRSHAHLFTDPSNKEASELGLILSLLCHAERSQKIHAALDWDAYLDMREGTPHIMQDSRMRRKIYKAYYESQYFYALALLHKRGYMTRRSDVASKLVDATLWDYLGILHTQFADLLGDNLVAQNMYEHMDEPRMLPLIAFLANLNQEFIELDLGLQEHIRKEEFKYADHFARDALIGVERYAKIVGALGGPNINKDANGNPKYVPMSEEELDDAHNYQMLGGMLERESGWKALEGMLKLKSDGRRVKGINKKELRERLGNAINDIVDFNLSRFDYKAWTAKGLPHERALGTHLHFDLVYDDIIREGINEPCQDLDKFGDAVGLLDGYYVKMDLCHMLRKNGAVHNSFTVMGLDNDAVLKTAGREADIDFYKSRGFEPTSVWYEVFGPHGRDSDKASDIWTECRAVYGGMEKVIRFHRFGRGYLPATKLPVNFLVAHDAYAALRRGFTNLRGPCGYFALEKEYPINFNTMAYRNGYPDGIIEGRNDRVWLGSMDLAAMARLFDAPGVNRDALRRDLHDPRLQLRLMLYMVRDGRKPGTHMDSEARRLFWPEWSFEMHGPVGRAPIVGVALDETIPRWANNLKEPHWLADFRLDPDARDQRPHLDITHHGYRWKMWRCDDGMRLDNFSYQERLFDTKIIPGGTYATKMPFYSKVRLTSEEWKWAVKEIHENAKGWGKEWDESIGEFERMLGEAKSRIAKEFKDLDRQAAELCLDVRSWMNAVEEHELEWRRLEMIKDAEWEAWRYYRMYYRSRIAESLPPEWKEGAMVPISAIRKSDSPKFCDLASDFLAFNPWLDYPDFYRNPEFRKAAMVSWERYQTNKRLNTRPNPEKLDILSIISSDVVFRVAREEGELVDGDDEAYLAKLLVRIGGPLPTEEVLANFFNLSIRHNFEIPAMAARKLFKFHGDRTIPDPAHALVNETVFDTKANYPESMRLLRAWRRTVQWQRFLWMGDGPIMRRSLNPAVAQDVFEVIGKEDPRLAPETKWVDGIFNFDGQGFFANRGDADPIRNPNGIAKVEDMIADKEEGWPWLKAVNRPVSRGTHRPRIPPHIDESIIQGFMRDFETDIKRMSARSFYRFIEDKDYSERLVSLREGVKFKDWRLPPLGKGGLLEDRSTDPGESYPYHLADRSVDETMEPDGKTPMQIDMDLERYHQDEIFKAKNPGYTVIHDNKAHFETMMDVFTSQMEYIGYITMLYFNESCSLSQEAGGQDGDGKFKTMASTKAGMAAGAKPDINSQTTEGDILGDKPEAKTKAKKDAEARQETKPDAKAKPATKSGAKAKSASKAKVANEDETKPSNKPKAENKDETKPAAKPKAAPKSKTKSGAETETKPKAAPRGRAKSAGKTESESDAQEKPASKPRRGVKKDK